MRAWWFEGNDHGLVWSHGMAMVSGEVPVAAAADMWHEFGDGGDLAGFLKLLSVHTGTDVLSLPGFAIALRTAQGTWQLAARGPWAAQVDEEVVRGAGISTWAERSVGGGTAARVGRVDDPAVGRPLVAGLVVAGGLAWGDAVPAAEVLDEPDRPEESSEPAATLLSGPVATIRPEPVARVIPAPLPPAAPEPDAVPPDLPDWAASLLEEVPARVDPTPEPAEPALVVEQADVETWAPDGPDPEDGMVQVPRTAPAAPPQDGPSGRFARQYGDTELFSIEDAAVRVDPADDFIAGVPGQGAPGPDAQPGPAPAPSGGPFAATGAGNPHAEGDHDGHTVLAADFASRPTHPEAAPEPVQPGGVSVLGVACGQGHANPPHRSTCFECGAPLSGAAHRMPRPVLGRLRLPSGEEIELTKPLLVGRNPRVDRHQGTVLPRLVPLSQGHVSSNHLELRLEEWNVLAVDLHSTNGTFLRRPGDAPVRLGERPELLMDGDVLDLGHGVQLTLEGLR